MIGWLAEAMRSTGLDVREVDGWETRTRSGTFDPQGVMFHHTGGSGSAVNTVTYGRADLPGPLSNILIARPGIVYVIAAGKCNHAGYGGPWRNIPLDSGNSYLIGVEVENNGVDEPWTEQILDACDRVFAACLKALDRDASWCVGHKEWAPTRKPDPKLYPAQGLVDMDAYRERLARFMEGEEDDMYDEKDRETAAETLIEAKAARVAAQEAKTMAAAALEKSEVSAGLATQLARRIDKPVAEPTPGPIDYPMKGWLDRLAQRLLGLWRSTP